jgi:hypothetical protein
MQELVDKPMAVQISLDYSSLDVRHKLKAVLYAGYVFSVCPSVRDLTSEPKPWNRFLL